MMKRKKLAKTMNATVAHKVSTGYTQFDCNCMNVS